MKSNAYRKLFRIDRFARKYYCPHARLNQLRSDKRRAKRIARRHRKAISEQQGDGKPPPLFFTCRNQGEFDVNLAFVSCCSRVCCSMADTPYILCSFVLVFGAEKGFAAYRSGDG
ncbi:MAG: hypothetical protein HFE45_06925 [Oscillospiraceae bacterium]|nr:hypothetical protein [Oscillospiraceae bacterium]